MADLTTVAEVKTYLSITGVGDDVLIQRLVTAASQLIEQFCNRVFALTTYTGERYNGTGTAMMVLNQGPVVSVSALAIDGIPVPVQAAAGQPGFVNDSQNLYLVGGGASNPYTASLGVFPRGFQNVAVTYQAGWAITPAEVTQACIELVAIKYRNRQNIGKVSDSVGGEPVTYNVAEMPASVKGTLVRYRKQPVW